jgi:hypothetical protein
MFNQPTIDRMLKVAREDYRFEDKPKTSAEKVAQILDAIAIDWADPSILAVVNKWVKTTAQAIGEDVVPS